MLFENNEISDVFEINGDELSQKKNIYVTSDTNSAQALHTTVLPTVISLNYMNDIMKIKNHKIEYILNEMTELQQFDLITQIAKNMDKTNNEYVRFIYKKMSDLFMNHIDNWIYIQLIGDNLIFDDYVDYLIDCFPTYNKIINVMFPRIAYHDDNHHIIRKILENDFKYLIFLEQLYYNSNYQSAYIMNNQNILRVLVEFTDIYDLLKENRPIETFIYFLVKNQPCELRDYLESLDDDVFSYEDMILLIKRKNIDIVFFDILLEYIDKYISDKKNVLSDMLYHLCYYSNTKCVRIFLDKYAFANDEISFKYSKSMLETCYLNDIDTFKLLLEYESVEQLLMNEYHTNDAIQFIIMNNNYEFLELLLSHVSDHLDIIKSGIFHDTCVRKMIMKNNINMIKIMEKYNIYLSNVTPSKINDIMKNVVYDTLNYSDKNINYENNNNQNKIKLEILQRIFCDIDYIDEATMKVILNTICYIGTHEILDYFIKKYDKTICFHEKNIVFMLLSSIKNIYFHDISKILSKNVINIDKNNDYVYIEMIDIIDGSDNNMEIKISKLNNLIDFLETLLNNSNNSNDSIECNKHKIIKHAKKLCERIKKENNKH
jgi:hypothetical protein